MHHSVKQSNWKQGLFLRQESKIARIRMKGGSRRCTTASNWRKRGSQQGLQVWFLKKAGVYTRKIWHGRRRNERPKHPAPGGKQSETSLPRGNSIPINTHLFHSFRMLDVMSCYDVVNVIEVLPFIPFVIRILWESNISPARHLSVLSHLDTFII